MAVVGEATVVVKGDASKFGPETEKQVAAGLDPVVKRVASVLGGAFVGAKVFGSLKAGLDELNESAKVGAQTDTILKNLGASAGVTSGEVDDLSAAMLKQSGVDDEVAKSAENVLLRLGVTGDAFKRATQDSNDLSVAMGTDMTSSAELLGKALAHPEMAARLLKPAIGGLTDAQKDAIKAFQATGDEAGAQGVIFDALESKVKGSAEAYGQTLPGQLAIAQESIKNAKAALVVGLAPALDSVAGLATTAAEGIQELPAPLQTAIGGALGLGAAFFTLARPINEGIGLLRTLGVLHQTVAVEAQGQAAAELEVAEAQTAANATGSTLTTTLGKAGIAGAAIAAVGGLYLFGRSLNDTTASAKDAEAATRLGADAANKMLDQLLSIRSGAFADEGDSMLKQLAEQGQAGIGVLQQYRDHLVATGQDTSKVDAALAGAAESQANLNANMDAGKGSADDEAKALDAAGKAADGFGGFISDLAGAMDKTYKASVSQTEQTSHYEAAVDSLIETLGKGSDVLYENAQTLDLTSKKGRENVDAVLATGDAIAKLIEKRFEETHSTQDAIDVGAMYVQNLTDQLTAAGYNEEQIAAMIDTMNLTPEDIKTTFSNNAVEQQVVVGKYLALIKDIPPEQQTKIEALINQGAYDGALALINEITAPRTLDIYITTHGTVNIPDLGPGANKEFHGEAGLAGGTDYWRGGFTWVGEGGKELAWLPRGSQVLPNDRLAGFANGLTDSLEQMSGGGRQLVGAGARGGDHVEISVDARGAVDPWSVGSAVGSSYVESKWRYPRR